MRIFFLISPNCYAASRTGTAQRTISQPAASKIPYLLHRGAHVARVGLGHRLHGDRRVAADFDFAELDGSGFAALNHVSTIENRQRRVNKLKWADGWRPGAC